MCVDSLISNTYLQPTVHMCRSTSPGFLLCANVQHMIFPPNYQVVLADLSIGCRGAHHFQLLALVQNGWRSPAIKGNK